MSINQVQLMPTADQLLDGKQPSQEDRSPGSDTPSTLPNQDSEKIEHPKSQQGDAPDGGLAAWLVVLGAWCVSFCSFGWLNSMTKSLVIQSCYLQLINDQASESSRSIIRPICSAAIRPAPSHGSHHCSSL